MPIIIIIIIIMPIIIIIIIIMPIIIIIINHKNIQSNEINPCFIENMVSYFLNQNSF